MELEKACLFYIKIYKNDLEGYINFYENFIKYPRLLTKVSGITMLLSVK